MVPRRFMLTGRSDPLISVELFNSLQVERCLHPTTISLKFVKLKKVMARHRKKKKKSLTYWWLSWNFLRLNGPLGMNWVLLSPHCRSPALHFVPNLDQMNNLTAAEPDICHGTVMLLKSLYWKQLTKFSKNNVNENRIKSFSGSVLLH